MFDPKDSFVQIDAGRSRVDCQIIAIKANNYLGILIVEIVLHEVLPQANQESLAAREQYLATVVGLENTELGMLDFETKEKDFSFFPLEI